MPNGPEKKYKAGSVQATIWTNTRSINGRDVEIKSVRIERIYQDQQGRYKGTSTYNINDIPKLILVAIKAFTDLVLKNGNGGEQE